MSQAATKSKYSKISKSYILNQPQPPGACDVSEAWATLRWANSPSLVLYHHTNFKYWTLFVSGTELRTNRWTDGQTYGRTIRFPDAPGQPFIPWHKNILTEWMSWFISSYVLESFHFVIIACFVFLASWLSPYQWNKPWHWHSQYPV